MMEVNSSRKLSDFMCREMIYDYINNDLDEHRKKPFEAYLKENPEFKKEIESVKQAMEYCELLSKTELTEPVMTFTAEGRKSFKSYAKKLTWYRRNNTLKWILEAGAVAVVVAVAASFLPWNKYLNLDTKSITLAEVEFNKRPDVSDTVVEKPEVVKEEVADSKVSSKKDEPVKDPDPPAAIAKPSDEVAQAPPIETTKAAQGILYRINFEVRNLDRNNQEILRKILSLGGERGGRVELGWKKNDGSRYYHAVLPKKRLDDFQRYLKRFTKDEIKKLIHPRVMPDDKIRLIMLIKESPNLRPQEIRPQTKKLTTPEEAPKQEETVKPEPVVVPPTPAPTTNQEAPLEQEEPQTIEANEEAQ